MIHHCRKCNTNGQPFPPRTLGMLGKICWRCSTVLNIKTGRMCDMCGEPTNYTPSETLCRRCHTAPVPPVEVPDTIAYAIIWRRRVRTVEGFPPGMPAREVVDREDRYGRRFIRWECNGRECIERLATHMIFSLNQTP